MARYFFDIHDGTMIIDDVGVECADLVAMRREAKMALPEMARQILPDNDDRHTIRVLVRDDVGKIVYVATLIFSGQMMP